MTAKGTKALIKFLEDDTYEIMNVSAIEKFDHDQHTKGVDQHKVYMAKWKGKLSAATIIEIGVGSNGELKIHSIFNSKI